MFDFELKNIPDWVKTNRFDGDFRQSLPVLFNGLDGLFRLGTEVLGNEIAILPLHFAFYSNKRELDLYCLLERLNLFCCVKLFNHSATNVCSGLTILEAKGLNISGLKVFLVSFKTSVLIIDDNNEPQSKSYYCCELSDFEVLPREKGLRNIALANSIDFSEVDVQEVECGD